MPHSGAKLFQPVRVGNCELSHRVVLAPLTRYCADDAHVPTDLMVEYYAQRACIPGTLAITEATFIAPKAGGYDNAPGIWSDEQVDAWKKVVDAVHAQGSYIFMQLWQLGRTAMPEILSLPDCPKNPGGPYPFVSSSAVAMPERRDGPLPRPLEHEEILEYIEIFGKAAHNAVHRAGFDGVEIHAAHGYLLDQFLQDTCNKRTDQWGGSIENRTRGIRITPFNTMQGKCSSPACPLTLVSRIREAYPRFAYLHTVEPRISGYFDREVQAWESNDFLRSIWKSPDSEKNGSAFLSAGGYTPENALKDAEEKGDLIVFGRYYIPNPDLPARIRKEIPFTPYDRSKFYISGVTAEGYIDYTFADAETQTLYNTKREVRVRAQIKNQTVANGPGEA